MTTIYLHGFASGPGSKKAQYFAARFAERGERLEVPDLAEGDFENLTITGQLAVIERLAGGGPVRLIGSSLGGYLAALYAARHPETERVVLMAPGFGFARRWPLRLGSEPVARWKQTGSLPFFHYGENAERHLKYTLITDGVGYEDYPAVTQPCLIYQGVKDDVVPVEWSREFAAGRPNVVLREADSDHELINILDAMWVGVREFLGVPHPALG
ncbi:MAG: alpha/beta fold hydrolase [Acidobacteria bacterium]|nr:alpha/beta fold hydrolase [Acidobacteriota bacterium]